jgi:8-oxo-dGTP pyrophosphatase MutT (NUDIX family)
MGQTSPRHRPAARVLCLDPAGRVLLLRWRDPGDGTIFWEPPGGGLEPGESPIAAARRELLEETGLPADAVLERHIVVQRDFRWNGSHFAGPETFFLGRVTAAGIPGAAGLTDGETGALLGHGWFTRDELAACPEPLQPPELPAILDELEGAGAT